MVDDAAVHLLGDPLVEAAVPCLHVEDGDVAALGGDGGQAAVGIAEHQESVRFLLFQDRVDAGDDLTDGLRGGGSGCLEVIVRLPQLQVLEENLVQLVVEVLARVHQDVVHGAVQGRNHPREADNLRSGADHGHHLHSLAHGCTSSGNWSG